MKQAILKLRQQVKDCAAKSCDFQRQIRILKYGSEENAQLYGRLRKTKDRNTRAERKALRHPETGGERWQLRREKRDHKDDARHVLLAYGFVRGRPYASMEQKCKVSPSAGVIRWHIIAALGEENVPWTKEQISAWLEGSVAEEAKVA
jgi:hypothetical protein